MSPDKESAWRSTVKITHSDLPLRSLAVLLVWETDYRQANLEAGRPVRRIFK